MRQHMLNGWLVAALVALVCLLGVTAYAAVKDDLPHTACPHGNRGIGEPCPLCGPAPCEGMAPRA
ncbi:hypothetical protein ACVDG5_017135 [Mesorhizobium sp. ORM6]